LPDSMLYLSATFFFLCGLCFGSFLNVIVYRLPKHLSLVSPPSRCPSCKRRLGVIDLVPLAGYLIIGGRCRSCGIKISPRYPLVELATGLLFLFLFLRFSLSIDFFFFLGLLFLLLAIALIDLEHRIVPNRLVATGLLIAFIFYLPKLAAIWFNLPAWLLVSREPLDALWGLLLGGGLMLIIFLVSRGGMGAGDIKLMIMIGFYVGLRGTVVVLFSGFIFGALVGLTFMILGRLTRKDALPFAPYLALATLIEVFWGEQIWQWYINLLQ
jgi:leader peptidase (prepilin peptidase) / N-methyltransferase